MLDIAIKMLYTQSVCESYKYVTESHGMVFIHVIYRFSHREQFAVDNALMSHIAHKNTSLPKVNVVDVV